MRPNLVFEVLWGPPLCSSKMRPLLYLVVAGVSAVRRGRICQSIVDGACTFAKATQDRLSADRGFPKTSRIASKLIVINLLADGAVDKWVGLLDGFPLKSTRISLCSAMASRNCLMYSGRWCKGDMITKATIINKLAFMSPPCGFGPCIHQTRR